MFGFTAKITGKKVFCAVVIILIPLLIFAGVKLASTKHSGLDTSAENIEKRIGFLAQFGWECAKNSETVKSTTIPDEFDEVYSSYNEIQVAQGFDLTHYCGKIVNIYTLKVLNYPENSEYVYATLMVFNGKIIGGDIHSAAMNGFLHGFDLTGTGLTFGQRVTEKSE